MLATRKYISTSRLSPPRAQSEHGLCRRRWAVWHAELHLKHLLDVVLAGRIAIVRCWVPGAGLVTTAALRLWDCCLADPVPSSDPRCLTESLPPPSQAECTFPARLQHAERSLS
jgi:hypothetical protein